MTVMYSVGIFLTSGNISKNRNLLAAHFVASVALSGSLSPQMYIHLKQAQEDQSGVPSYSLPSLRAATVVNPEVSLYYLTRTSPTALIGYEY